MYRVRWKARRAKAVVLYALLAGVALVVLIVHYPEVGWVLLPWLIAFGCAVGEARNADRELYAHQRAGKAVRR